MCNFYMVGQKMEHHIWLIVFDMSFRTIEDLSLYCAVTLNFLLVTYNGLQLFVNTDINLLVPLFMHLVQYMCYVMLDSNKTIEGSIAAFLAQLISVLIIHLVGELHRCAVKYFMPFYCCCNYRPHERKRYTITSVHLSTHPSLCTPAHPFVSTLSFEPTDLCMCMGHDHSSSEIEGQGQRSRLTLTQLQTLTLIPTLTRSVWPRSLVEDSFVVCCVFINITCTNKMLAFRFKSASFIWVTLHLYVPVNSLRLLWFI